MNTGTFWHIIEAAKAESQGDSEQQAKLLERQLVQLPITEIQSFDRLLWQFVDEAYNQRLWAAAYLMNGGCSDDRFMDFRGWLIAQGEAAFHAALQDPDTLADVIEPLGPPLLDNDECEDLLFVAWHAYEAIPDQELPAEVALSRNYAEEAQEEYASSEEEDTWENGDLKEEYARKYLPKLWAKFGW